MTVTWTNGIVSMTSDFIFGVSVLAETGWVPLADLNTSDIEYVRKLVDHNPACPFLTQLYGA